MFNALEKLHLKSLLLGLHYIHGSIAKFIWESMVYLGTRQEERF